MRMSRSLPSSLGVVPEEIRLWNPEIAPQAMVMHTKGKTGPGTTNPLPSTKRVMAGMCSIGRVATMKRPSTATVPSFMKVLR